MIKMFMALGLLFTFTGCISGSSSVQNGHFSNSAEASMTGFLSFEGNGGRESDQPWPTPPEAYPLGAYYYAPSRAWKDLAYPLVRLAVQEGKPLDRNFWQSAFQLPPRDFSPSHILETGFTSSPFSPLGPKEIRFLKLPPGLVMEPLVFSALEGPRNLPLPLLRGTLGERPFQVLITRDWEQGPDYREGFFNVSSFPRFPRPQHISGQTGDGLWAAQAHGQRFVIRDEAGSEWGDLQAGRYRIFPHPGNPSPREVLGILSAVTSLRHFLVYLRWLTDDLKGSQEEFEERLKALGAALPEE